MMNNKKCKNIFMGLSIIAAVAAGYVSVFQKELFNLAGTQWMLIAIILGIFGLYAQDKNTPEQ
jgi:uncharacterized membrane protein YuzA (DUF378 family)